MESSIQIGDLKEMTLPQQYIDIDKCIRLLEILIKKEKFESYTLGSILKIRNSNTIKKLEQFFYEQESQDISLKEALKQLIIKKKIIGRLLAIILQKINEEVLKIISNTEEDATLIEYSKFVSQFNDPPFPKVIVTLQQHILNKIKEVASTYEGTTTGGLPNSCTSQPQDAHAA